MSKARGDSDPTGGAARLRKRELQRLLDVGRTLVTELDLESVLHKVLDTARDLTGARYAAIGVLNDAKLGLAAFVYAGIDEQQRQVIGPFPRGLGVLGELVRRPEPLMLHDVTDHPRSYGFPPGHPPMKTFLGVPIQVGGEAFGNLYLTEKAGGADFDERDRESVLVLSEWAAIAIDNARLYTRLEERRVELERAVRGLEATAAVARSVGVETHLDRVLELIAHRGRELIDARSFVVVLHLDGEARVVAAAGESSDNAVGRVLSNTSTVAGSALNGGAPQRIDDLRATVGHGLGNLADNATSALVVPLGFRARARGLLVAFDCLHQGPGFVADDEHILASFAASAAIAIATAQSVENERLRDTIEASEQERRRWARELHDDTLQELGALKVMLDSARPGTVDDIRDRALEQIDLSIKGLQSLITELRPAALDDLGVGPALATLLRRTATTSGVEIQATLDLAYDAGRAATRLVPGIENTVYRLVQESLTNVVKHAHAERVHIELHESDGWVTVLVRDDGLGFDSRIRDEGLGLVGMRERVMLVGGDLTIESTPGEGTVVRARVPAEHPPQATPGRAA